MKLTDTVQNEFWFHVSNQDEIPIFGIVDKSLDVELLLKLINDLPESNKISQIKYLSDYLIKDSATVDILRTLVGISDKRMYLELSYIFAKTKINDTDGNNILGKTLYELDKHPLDFFKNLLVAKNPIISKKSAEIITKYLVDKQLIEILLVLKRFSKDEINTIIDKLILPKEMQQAEAKRRGHGAEHSLAVILHLLGTSFIPKDKHINPMSSNDPNVNIDTFEIVPKKKGETYSFDLIIENQLQTPLIFLQGLIHTSDPGQYGVNKSDETVMVKENLSIYNTKNKTNKELWGLVDGVGFSENKKDTIDKMLTKFDCFVQLKSMYKAGLRLHKLKLIKLYAIRFDEKFYSKDESDLMFKKYGSSEIKVVSEGSSCLSGKKEIKAGKAWLYI